MSLVLNALRKQTFVHTHMQPTIVHVVCNSISTTWAVVVCNLLEKFVLLRNVDHLLLQSSPKETGMGKSILFDFSLFPDIVRAPRTCLSCLPGIESACMVACRECIRPSPIVGSFLHENSPQSSSVVYNGAQKKKAADTTQNGTSIIT